MAKNRPGFKRELVASWRFIYGDVNFRALHIYKYPHVRFLSDHLGEILMLEDVTDKASMF